MTDTNMSRTRGRPRGFDVGEAVAVAQRLFHTRGYDALGVADMTEALGIKPPSFYAAFGSKAGLYRRVLERYAEHGAVPFAALLRDDREVAESLAEILEVAAERYAAAQDATGCLVIEGMHSIDDEASAACRAMQGAAAQGIRDYITARHPEAAESLTDFMSVTLAGMSATARQGVGIERLRAVAHAASRTVASLLERSEGSDG